jgi:hypothetical protein
VFFYAAAEKSGSLAALIDVNQENFLAPSLRLIISVLYSLCTSIISSFASIISAIFTLISSKLLANVFRNSSSTIHIS